MTSTKTEHPILFSGEMVRAILEGRKTQTRRVIRPQIVSWHEAPIGAEVEPNRFIGHGSFLARCPLGEKGDRLWVRETFAVQPFLWERNHDLQPVHYPATSRREEIEDYAYKPSIHMPRWASRVTLEVVDVRVERLQEISHDDALAEGADPEAPYNNYATGSIYRDTFASMWDSIYAKRRGCEWVWNPWVWVVEFAQVEGFHARDQ